MSTVTGFLTELGNIVTEVISWLGEMLTFVTGNPVILVPLLMFFVVGGVVGILMRILRG
jgi:hypothetical protein|nr:MAG TPA: hypothetical protein [Inoviridae sp.]